VVSLSRYHYAYAYIYHLREGARILAKKRTELYDEADAFVDGADVEYTPDPAKKLYGQAVPIFETAEEFEELANAYFDFCDDEDRLYGEAGLALYLTAHNRKKRNVTLTALRDWYVGERSPHLQESVKMAYLRIQDQIDHDPRYQDKAMATRGIFLQKQKWYGGYTDRPKDEAKELKVNVVMNGAVSEEMLKG